MSNFIYTDKAAQVAGGVSLQTLQNWLKRGYIEGKQLPTRRWLISEQSLRDFIAGRGQLKGANK
jgi:predicted site-specific integrase-resolvase